MAARTLGLARAGDPRLAPHSELAFARALVAAYRPWCPDQELQRARILVFVDAHADALHRSCLAGHLTSSAIVLDHERARVLLTLHKKLGKWLQLGGHCDGEANLALSALREATEESGIEGLAIDPVPIDLDVHGIPARPGEPEHLHLDARYVVVAPAGARAAISAESDDLRWFAPAEIESLATDDSVRRLVPLALGRATAAR